jgi:Xaa-Pro aminopeptidase
MTGWVGRGDGLNLLDLLDSLKKGPFMLSSLEKLTMLRAALKKEGVGGFILPRSDEYQNEYVPSCAERLAFLTGFTGSAGYAAVLTNRAVAASDGRYAIQIRQQVDKDLFDIEDSTKTSIGDWIAKSARPGEVIGYDPRLYTPKQIRAIEEKLSAAEMTLKPLAENPVDKIWKDRPAQPRGKVELFPMQFAGESSGDKRERIAKAMAEQNISAAILTLPDSICWLLNVRGADVAHNPVVLSFAILHDDSSVDWFVDKEKVSGDISSALGSGVHILALAEFEEALKKLKGKVLADPQRTSCAVFECLKNAVEGKDPCIQPKACKNEAEQSAMRRAHHRDGVAMARFMFWMAEQDFDRDTHTELTLADKLEEFRREAMDYRDSSFDTICGWDAHGAIIHYLADETSSVRIIPPGILLLDSGAQYADGTTDITRTFALGAPEPDVREHYTRVLKGHISLAKAKFPHGTTGTQLDAFARQSLWDGGLDYAHGTGHGVGCYLSVHEEAAGISPRGADPLQPGMIVSNEPGYYREGAYGIRIENLILCRDTGSMFEDGRKILEFETLTLVPYDRLLIEVSMLAREERDWLNAYHALVRESILPFLKTDEEREWLAQATAAV